MQSEGQQQTLQRAVDEGSQHGGGVRRGGDPHAEGIDARLDQRPHHRQPQRDDYRPQDDHQRHEALSAKEGQRLGQAAEVVEPVVDRTACKACDHADKHAHVQRRTAQHLGEVAAHSQLLAEQAAHHSALRRQHIARDAKGRAGDGVDEHEGQHACEGAACAILRPAAANGRGKEQMQVADHGPADLLHHAADGLEEGHVRHLDQLAQGEHQTGSWHHGDDGHQRFAQLLQEIKADGGPGSPGGAQGQERVGAGPHAAAGGGEGQVFRAVGEDDGGERLQAPGAQQLQVDLRHQVARANAVARLHMEPEALAAQLHRVQADVYQHLQSVIGGEADGVAGLGDGGDHPVDGAEESAVRGADGGAVPQNAAGENLVRHVRQRNDLTAQGRKDALQLFHGGIPSLFMQNGAGRSPPRSVCPEMAGINGARRLYCNEKPPGCSCGGRR